MDSSAFVEPFDSPPYRLARIGRKEERKGCLRELQSFLFCLCIVDVFKKKLVASFKIFV